MHRVTWFGTLVVGIVCGCGDAEEAGGGDPAPNDTGSIGVELEGIYTLDTITENDGSCEPGGESLRDVVADSHLVAKRGAVQNSAYLALASCAGPAACRELATLLGTSLSAGDGLKYAFFAAGPENTLTGSSTYPGTYNGTSCIDGGNEKSTLARVGTALTVEQRGHLGDYPADSGVCTISAATTQAASLPCTRLRVVTGTFAEPL